MAVQVSVDLSKMSTSQLLPEPSGTSAESSTVKLCGRLAVNQDGQPEEEKHHGRERSFEYIECRSRQSAPMEAR